jgi:hypothetical protein
MLFWTLTLALVVIAYVLLIVWILPKFMLKSNYPIPQPTDRGLKKYKFSDSDYAVVYEPSLSARKYITQYVLAKKDGKKIIKCKVAANVTYIDFDIALFDAHEHCFQVIHSMDLISSDGVTDAIELPDETAYASVIINQVDQIQLRHTHTSTISASRLFGFGTLALIISVLTSVLVMISFSNIFGGVFRETFAEKMLTSGWVFIFPSIICAACIIGACYVLFSRNSKR